MRLLADKNVCKMVALADMLAQFMEDMSRAAAATREVALGPGTTRAIPREEQGGDSSSAASAKEGVALRGLSKVSRTAKPLPASALPKLNVTAIRPVSRLITPTSEMIDEFLYDYAPAWVHEPFRGIHLPLARIAEHAGRRVMRATTQAGLVA